MKRLIGKLALLAILAGSAPNAVRAGAAGGESPIWIEAESAARHNFPPFKDNPFRAQAFWEADLLSGGEWIGMFWQKGNERPFLEYDFEVTEGGIYSLYVRKFFTYGNFQWRVDDGDWINPILTKLHAPIDMVTMRESGERINLSWFYMGKVEIAPGRHTLRIEPLVTEDKARLLGKLGTPVAFDTFVLTRAPFFPSGKLKPGERAPGRDGQAFAFQPEIDTFAADALDLRGLNEKVAGERGGIEVRDGRLVFRDNGEPVRMVGINYNWGKALSRESTEHLARSLAKRGLNFVRVDIAPVVTFSRGQEGEPIVAALQEASLQQLAMLLSALKKQGIFFGLTWNVAQSEGFRALFDPAVERIAKAQLESSEPVSDNSPAADLTSILFFEPQVRDAVRKVWDTVLKLQLEDGQTLVRDPALFLITFSQQSSLLSEHTLEWEVLPSATREAFGAAWRSWLEKKYGSVKKALRAWNAPDDEQHAAQVPSMPEILDARDTRARDALRFLVETQAAQFQAQLGELRAAGYQGLVSFSNKSYEHPELLGFASIQTRMVGDLIERHGNFRGDFQPRYDIWNFSEGAIFTDRSPVRLDAQQGLEMARFELPMKAPRYAGKPSALTEIGIALPNRFSGEMPLATFTLAALQDVSMVGFTSLATENWQGSLSPARNQLFTPAILGQMPALAFAFRKGLLPGPVIAGRMEIAADTAFSLEPAPFFEPPETQLNIPLRVPEQSDSPHAPDPALWLTGAIEVKLNAPAERFTPVNPGKIDADGRIETASGSVRWNPQRRLLEIDAPAFHAVSGALRDAGTIRLGKMEIRSDMESGTICAVALDEQPLDFSAKILVQVFSEEFNAGYNAQKAGGLSVIRSSGRPPLLVKAIKGEITFLRPDADELVATALDANGNPLVPAGMGATLRFLPATTSYLLEK